jgi:hypothetical protein
VNRIEHDAASLLRCLLLIRGFLLSGAARDFLKPQRAILV